jgi:hypothetical protein
LIGGVLGVMEIPAPLWFVIVDLVSYVPCGMLGASVVSSFIRPAQPAAKMN